MCGVEPVVFFWPLHELVGQPVHSYLVSRRMEEAALMLKSTDDAILPIAIRVGYATRAAFLKVFQKHYGTSPGRYRARNPKGRSLVEEIGQ